MQEGGGVTDLKQLDPALSQTEAVELLTLARQHQHALPIQRFADHYNLTPEQVRNVISTCAVPFLTAATAKSLSVGSWYPDQLASQPGEPTSTGGGKGTNN